MRLRTRTFLWSLVPFALLLTGSFWFVQRMVLATVREQFRASVRETQTSMSRQRAKAEEGNRHMLRIIAENPALKNGLQLLLLRRDDAAARRTVEDQLADIGSELGFDLLLVSDPEGRRLAGIACGGSSTGSVRDRAATKGSGFCDGPLGSVGLQPPQQGYFKLGGRMYRMSSVPVDQGGETLGMLTVGEQFDLAGLAAPAILLQHGHVVESSSAGVSESDIESALRSCPAGSDCDLRIGGSVFASATLDQTGTAGGYELRTLQNLDTAARPIQATLRGVFLISGIFALAGAVAVSDISSRSIVRPISAVVARLRESARTGELPDFRSADFESASSAQEIYELTIAFHRAASAVRESRQQLSDAVLEFIQSLASALDARDPYTAGHSRRVSQYACAIARSMQLPPKEIDDIRVGALLHDIGKIGVSDNILLKPGRLTDEENRLIQEHPSIGRKILESVHGFQNYLPVVELHHENWDGTGYPRGLRREETPLAARIVKIADAYDAMTSDRPYRRGMCHQEALAVLARFSGTQMDPGLVDLFLSLGHREQEFAAALNPADSLTRLAEAVGQGGGQRVQPETFAAKEVS